MSDDLSVGYAGRPTASRERLWWQVRDAHTQDGDERLERAGMVGGLAL